jgi:carbon-monoxide dehydrogenase large subunit
VGIKGMAEGGVMGAIGAIGNAIQDALGHLGVRIDTQPFTPMALHGLIHAAARSETPAPATEGATPS